LSAVLVEVQWVFWALIYYLFHTARYKLYTAFNITN
jgi:hypothetical protein